MKKQMDRNSDLQDGTNLKSLNAFIEGSFTKKK